MSSVFGGKLITLLTLIQTLLDGLEILPISRGLLRVEDQEVRCAEIFMLVQRQAN